jgi:hypothetical protein
MTDLLWLEGPIEHTVALRQKASLLSAPTHSSSSHGSVPSLPGCDLIFLLHRWHCRKQPYSESVRRTVNTGIPNPFDRAFWSESMKGGVGRGCVEFAGASQPIMENDPPPSGGAEGESAETDSAPAMAGAEAGTEAGAVVEEKDAAADGDAGTGGDGKEEEVAIAPGKEEGEGEAPPVFEKTNSAPTTPAIEVDPSLPTDNFTRLSIAQSMSVEALRKSGMWIEVSSDKA